MDVRQIMSAVLTFSMFVMLANMIKRDHFEADILLDVPVTSKVQHEVSKVSRQNLVDFSSLTWKEHGQPLKLCWNNSLPLTKGEEDSKGYITLSLTGGPEYHVSQVANGVVVAKHLGATLVLPYIIESNGHKRDFEEIYDAEKFMTSMSGIIRVERLKNPEALTQNLTTVNVPYKVNKNYTTTRIEPLFRKTGNLRIVNKFPSLIFGRWKADQDMTSYSCLAMFEAMRLQPKLREAVDSIVGRLRSREPNGVLAAIDFKGEMLGKGVCGKRGNKGMKSCYNALEIGEFLEKIGVQKDTTIYVTQSKWDSSLDALKSLYPNTLTKEDIMEETEKGKYLNSTLEEEIIDFHICSVSDVFVPAMSGLFYVNVVGNRIAANKTNVLVPAQITSTSPNDHISSYISNKTHPAYSCFC